LLAISPAAKSPERGAACKSQAGDTTCRNIVAKLNAATTPDTEYLPEGQPREELMERFNGRKVPLNRDAP
jgi:hypothetical protein